MAIICTTIILPPNALRRDCNGKCVELIEGHALEVVVEVYIWWLRELIFISNLSYLRLTKTCKHLFKWYSYWHKFPQLFPLLLAKALMRWCVLLRWSTRFINCPKYHRNRCVFMRTFPRKDVFISPYMRTFPKGRMKGYCRPAGNTSLQGLHQQRK